MKKTILAFGILASTVSKAQSMFQVYADLDGICNKSNMYVSKAFNLDPIDGSKTLTHIGRISDGILTATPYPEDRIFKFYYTIKFKDRETFNANVKYIIVNREGDYEQDGDRILLTTKNKNTVALYPAEWMVLFLCANNR